jgi:serine/threonine-protein kinase
LEAIDLFGSDTRAYEKLLEAYKENGEFGDEQSNQFTAKYNKNKESFDVTSTEYLDLVYDAGITYFYLYSGNDNSFRTRVLKAQPYFETIVDSGNTSYSYYSVSESYQIIGDFYSHYVVDVTSVKEPTKESYESLLDSLKVCIEKMDDYDYDDAAYIKLTMYQEIANLLNDHRNGMAQVGVGKDQVIEPLTMVYEKAKALTVTQQTSIDLQQTIESSYSVYVDNIDRAYLNSQERGE